MSKIKSISLKILTILRVVSKRKWIYFGTLTVFLFGSVVLVIKYCDMPIWNNMPQFYIKPENSDMLFYNLSVSYIASYLFYLLVNFIPDWIDAVEGEKELIALRCVIQREIQLFTYRCMSIWSSMGRAASVGEIDNINGFFNRRVIQQISTATNISANSDTMSFNTNYIDWCTKIVTELNVISTSGNSILTRYKNDIPSEMFYNLFYIINENSMIGSLNVAVQTMTALYGRNIILSQCMDFENGTGGDGIDRSCRSIVDLHNWVNSEYDYLINHISGENIKIYRIERSAYLAR
ncbi:hypothetical protein [Clostridium tagluense]|uniref:hypothetical protein n=1 Tax=Clostridium tagluense TaxID=360422 RepID=UPI001CF4A1C2|nr:hypothetical protein [Clostridium tagluense]MCB2300126.1 hypothetical protein [Clostridium tagluense]